MLNPLETLKLVACSSIFGEPQYYRPAEKKAEGKAAYDDYYEYGGIIDKEFHNMSTTEVFQKVIDDALDYDFLGTLRFAVKLRHDFYMRLNPQVIMVRAALHPKRKEFTDANPGLFHQLNKLVMYRADEPAVQATYYLWLTGDKKKMPSVLKRSLAQRLASLSKYQINKYKNAEIGMINTVRITHAHSTALDELMRTGNVTVEKQEDITWEQLASDGMKWREIAQRQVETSFMGHMALLRNLRNIFEDLHEPEDREIAEKLLAQLMDGVANGKQFPFRYSSAHQVISDSSRVRFKSLILDTLEECVDIAIKNMPRLKGKTVALTDNSGSAWGAYTSEYGKTTVAEIDNLSGVLAVMASDYGEVGAFGDKLRMYSISKRNGALTQAKTISAQRGHDVGHSTEGGIWEFFRDIIKNKTHVDNIFIFSDMQAGCGQLYGTREHQAEYRRLGYMVMKTTRYTYRTSTLPFGKVEGCVDVYKLIAKYRQTVNPKVNVFCVQTAGYPNTIMPVMSYRTAFLAGWTGKEVQFASEYIKQWDEIEATRNGQPTKIIKNTEYGGTGTTLPDN